MAFVFQERHKPYVEARMQAFCRTLSEKDRRRYGAVEAARRASRTDFRRTPAPWPSLTACPLTHSISVSRMTYCHTYAIKENR
jgi:hypothetical protein